MKQETTTYKESTGRELLRRFKYNKSAVFGLIILLFMVFCAIAAALSLLMTLILPSSSGQ